MDETVESAQSDTAIAVEWPDAPLSVAEDVDDAALPEDLRELTRPADAVELDDLEEALTRYRVLVVRQQGIPLAVLAVIAASLLFNGAFLTVLILAYQHGGTLAALLPGHAIAESTSDGGSGTPTMTVLGDDSPLTGAAVASRVGALATGRDQASATPLVPVLPPLPAPTPADNASNTLLATATPNVIGVPLEGEQGVPHMVPPRVSRPDAIANKPPSPSQPQIALSTNSIRGPDAGPSSAAPAIAHTRAGADPHGSYDPTTDDPDSGDIVPMMKSGNGSGEGNGTGNGVDRGPGEDTLRPKFIGDHSPIWPKPTYVQAIKGLGATRVAFEVLPDQRIGEVKIVSSCGDSDVDEACVAALKDPAIRCLPESRNGKSITTWFQVDIGSFK